MKRQVTWCVVFGMMVLAMGCEDEQPNTTGEDEEVMEESDGDTSGGSETRSGDGSEGPQCPSIAWQALDDDGDGVLNATEDANVNCILDDDENE